MAWKADPSPGCPLTKQVMEQIFNFEEQARYATWESRQRMKRLDGFKEPFTGFFEGQDIWPGGASEAYYQSLQS